PAPPEPVAATPSAPPSLARASAPAQAPVQAIRTEAKAASPKPAGEPVRVDYGDELDLPTAGRETLRGADAFAISAAPPEPARGAPVARPARVPARTAPATAPVTTAPVPGPEAAADPDAQVRQIVVPIKLPAGARYEIVLRLQLDTTS